MTNSFTPTARSKLKRLHKRAAYDHATVNAVLDAGLICHVGYVIDGQPYVTPTCYWREGETLYWHGSSASRMLRAVKQGIPVCLTVTHFDGLVLARSGFHSSVNSRCVMAFGTARAVTDKAAKTAALEAFVERLAPGHWAGLRPMTAKELKATTVVSMEIEEASAKLRDGQPEDDEEDYALDIWAGVIPVRQVVGEPEPDPRLKKGVALPDHLKGYTIG
jgi:hypothetical protein